MANVRYVPNPVFEEAVRAQPQHEKGMRTITKRTAASVWAVAPHRTGYYKRHVKARGTLIVVSDRWAWHLIEFGSVNNRPYRPLARGVRAAGLGFVPAPKP